MSAADLHDLLWIITMTSGVLAVAVVMLHLIELLIEMGQRRMIAKRNREYVERITRRKK